MCVQDTIGKSCFLSHGFIHHIILLFFIYNVVYESLPQLLMSRYSHTIASECTSDVSYVLSLIMQNDVMLMRYYAIYH